MTVGQAVRKINEKSARIYELEKVLKDLLRCGDFHRSAIEIDPHIKDSISGEEFELRINELIN